MRKTYARVICFWLLASSLATIQASSLSTTDAHAWIRGVDDAPPECSSAMTGTTAAMASFSCMYARTIRTHTFDPMLSLGFASAQTELGPYGMGIETKAVAGTQDGLSAEFATAHALETITFDVQGSGSLWLAFQVDYGFGPYGNYTVEADGKRYFPDQDQLRNPLLLAAGQSHTLRLEASVMSDMGEPSRFRFFLSSAMYVSSDQSGPATWTGDAFAPATPFPSPTGVPEPSLAWMVAPALLFILARRRTTVPSGR